MYANQNIELRKVFNVDKLFILLKVLIFIILLFALYFGYSKFVENKYQHNDTLAIVSTPKINDIYFLDFRLLSDKLAPKEKYRIAKVVDITGDIITLVYGSFFYQRQHAAINSIKYGQLSYTDYFQPKRYNLPLQTIKDMHNSGAIYLANRPIRNKLYGNIIGPEERTKTSSQLIYGKKENNKGLSFLQDPYGETNDKRAFELFQKSSNLGYPAGQVNLAEMYINASHVEKDFTKALYWLKQASLQSYKPAILKYEIICNQVEACHLYDFYSDLVNSGVNIKVREMNFSLDK